MMKGELLKMGLMLVVMVMIALGYTGQHEKGEGGGR